MIVYTLRDTKDAPMSEAPVKVQVKRAYAASAERVFDAWLDPKMIAKFMFGSQLRDEEILHLKVDPRSGGRFSFLVRRGDTEIDHVGEYFDFNRPTRLSVSWSALAKGYASKEDPASRVTIDITPKGTGCELTLTHVIPAEWKDYADRTREGWTKMTDWLAAALS
jgi:uncharacterized protein YndB with AHSA1/START domain